MDRVSLKKGALLSELVKRMAQGRGEKIKNLLIDPDNNQISPAVAILLNGKMVHQLETPLQDGDEVTLFVGIAGG